MIRNPDSTKKSWTPSQPVAVMALVSFGRNALLTPRMYDALWISTMRRASPRMPSSAATCSLDGFLASETCGGLALGISGCLDSMRQISRYLATMEELSLK